MSASTVLAVCWQSSGCARRHWGQCGLRCSAWKNRFPDTTEHDMVYASWIKIRI